MVLRKDGFSLIEITMVLVVVGLMMLIIIPSYTTSTTQAKIAKTKAGLEKVRAAFSLYYADHNGYYPMANFPEALAPYLDEIPADGFENINTIVYEMGCGEEWWTGGSGGWCFSGDGYGGKVFPNLKRDDPRYGYEDFLTY